MRLNRMIAALLMVSGLKAEFLVTVPSWKTASDLDGYPLIIDLSDMPSVFWDMVIDGGGNVRAFGADGVTPLPLAVIWCDTSTSKGIAVVKTDLSAEAATSVRLVVYSGVSAPEDDDPYAWAAVFDDCQYVWFGGSSNRDWSGNSTAAHAWGDPDNFEKSTLHTFTQDPHQGVAFDHANRKWYVIDTNAIYKFDEGFTTLEATNSNPVGDVNTLMSETVLDHCCDACVANGYLVVPINDYVGSSGSPTTAYIARFSLDDLTAVNAVEIAGYEDISGICWDAEAGLYVACSWDSMTALWRFGADFAHHSDIALSYYTPFSQAQGIEKFDRGYFVTSDSTDEVYRIEADGYVQNTGLVGDIVTSTAYEGICRYDGSLVVLCDPTSVNSYLRRYERFGDALMLGGGTEITIGARVIGALASTGAIGTSWLAGATFAPSDNVQRTLMGLSETGTGTTNNAHIVVDDGNKLGVWDASNGWLYCSPNVDPALDTSHRVNVVYDGTTDRSIYYNGGSKGTDTTITARGSGISHLVIGNDIEGDNSSTQNWRGKLGYAYVRSIPDNVDDWIAAEYANLSDPGNFYSISAL